MLRPHTSRDYQTELQSLRERLLLMAGRVETMIHDAVQAFSHRDAELAKRTIAADHEVNQDEIDIDDACLRVLARRQPMASDLRFLTIALKMVTDLERIADLAVSICLRALDLRDGPNYALEDKIPEMAEIAQRMMSDAINAFVQGDAKLAREVIERDDEVDEIYHTTFREILAQMLDDPDFIERGIRIKSVAKFIERIGDHSTNLAEQVIFMLKGKDVRHPARFDGEEEERD